VKRLMKVSGVMSSDRKRTEPSPNRKTPPPGMHAVDFVVIEAVHHYMILAFVTAVDPVPGLGIGPLLGARGSLQASFYPQFGTCRILAEEHRLRQPVGHVCDPHHLPGIIGQVGIDVLFGMDGGCIVNDRDEDAPPVVRILDAIAALSDDPGVGESLELSSPSPDHGAGPVVGDSHSSG
jgi:hypothetical protein